MDHIVIDDLSIADHSGFPIADHSGFCDMINPFTDKQAWDDYVHNHNVGHDVSHGVSYDVSHDIRHDGHSHVIDGHSHVLDSDNDIHNDILHDNPYDGHTSNLLDGHTHSVLDNSHPESTTNDMSNIRNFLHNHTHNPVGGDGPLHDLEYYKDPLNSPYRIDDGHGNVVYTGIPISAEDYDWTRYATC